MGAATNIVNAQKSISGKICAAVNSSVISPTRHAEKNKKAAVQTSKIRDGPDEIKIE